MEKYLSVGELAALMELYTAAKKVFDWYSSPCLPFNVVETKRRYIEQMNNLGLALDHVTSLLDW